ncbi:MAG: T9SS type A sorting domain-containing protein [Bacteroidetes bacterium]|nr:T9SS type A sorting domain-containing protein [Bacteroidota bacterium]MBP6400952.1 T9SS type A sorting domain-containing protein [Bacteroidia bacterium]MBP6648718.1 T9SS type A sorting domain-containing protein [Bacteroidia bacterium]
MKNYCFNLSTIMKKKAFFFSWCLLITLPSVLKAQVGFDPCGPNGPGCSSGPAVGVFSPFCNDTVSMNQPATFLFGAMDAMNLVDTTYNSAATVSVVSGPGSVSGNLNGAFNKGILLLNGINVSVLGTYTFAVSSGSLPVYNCNRNFDTIPLSGNGFCFGAGPSVKVKVTNVPGGMNQNVPFNVEVQVWNAQMCMDSTFSGQVDISKLDGPGNLSGTTTANAVNGLVNFNGVQFDQPGDYHLLATSSGLASDTSMMIHINSGGGSNQNCPPTSTEGTRENMGLYGGSSLDLTWNYSNKRLFAAISSPASLFYSDDSCKVWHRAFPDDSLEYGCGRGWGGRAVRVLSNTNNWVAVQTSQEAGTLNALVISFDGGATWQTAMDSYMMNQLGFQSQNVSGMSLTDYYMYCLMGKYIVRVNSASAINPSTDLIDITTAISGISSNSQVKAIAAGNTSTGYPFYCIVDTTGQFGSNPGLLYKCDGTTFTPVTLPGGVSGFSMIFTHPGQVTADTLIALAPAMGGTQMYRSLDGGTSWTMLTGPGGNFPLSDVDYSPNWVSSMPQSNGMVMIIPGSAISTDMGDTWQTFQLQNNGGALHPDNDQVMVGTMGRGVVVSTNGVTGPFDIAPNYGLEAVQIKKIARTASKGTFYIATRAGLAYTTAYLDDAVAGYDKWNTPYGSFPISNVGDDAGVSAVAMDPNDSLHVVAGYSNGFSVTTTGVAGFSNVNPTGYNLVNGDPAVHDLLFVSSSIVLATTGGDNNSHSGKGNIWRSTDGGASWTNVSPVGFTNGQSLGKGSINGNNVIYCGTGLSGSMADPGTLWKSTDDGATWTQINFGPTASNNPSSTKLPIYDLAVDPRGTDTIYLACGSNTDYAFVKSNDGGSTYTNINANGEGAFTSVCINQNYPDSVYTAIRRDILVYNVLSDSAMYIYRGLPGELVPDLAFGSVLAGTSMGFFRVEPTALSTGMQAETPKMLTNEKLIIYPNPVKETATLSFVLEHRSTVDILVLDLLGNCVWNQHQENVSNGRQNIRLNTNQWPAGAYCVRVSFSDGTQLRKFIKVD